MAAWLRGKVANSLKAFQLRLATLSVCLCLCFIPSHASENKHALSLFLTHTHTHTHTHKQHQGGKTTLGPGDSQSSRKHLQGFEVRMRTLGNYGVPSPENKAYEKKRHTCAIRLYTVILHTHLETLKRSAADTHTHTHTRTWMQTGKPRETKQPVKTKKYGV